MILNGESSCFEAGSRGFGHEAEYPRVWKAPKERRRDDDDKGTILKHAHFAEGCLVAKSFAALREQRARGDGARIRGSDFEERSIAGLRSLLDTSSLARRQDSKEQENEGRGSKNLNLTQFRVITAARSPIRPLCIHPLIGLHCRCLTVSCTSDRLGGYHRAR